MSNLPFTDGLTHYFDYNNFESNEWVNQSTGGNLIVTGGVKDSTNKYVHLPAKTGYAYCPYNIGDNCTVYAVVKGGIPTGFSGTSWGIAICGANSSYRVFCGQKTTNNFWDFYAPNNLSTNILAAEWHVMAFSVANGVQKLYFDGELIATSSTVRNFALKGLYINNGAYNGAALSGTSTYSADIYLRCVALCTVNHTDEQIKANSEQLAVDFNLKLPAKNSRLAGADAVAIGYAIAKNKEASDALTSIVKAYRDGTVNGDDGDGDVTEPYVTTDPEEEIPLPDPTDPNNGDGTVSTDGPITDFKNGWWYTFGDDESGIDDAYVRVWIEPYEYTTPDGQVTQKNKIYFTVYDGNGEEVRTSYVTTQYKNDTFGRTDTVTSFSLSADGKNLLFHKSVNDNGNSFTQTTVAQLFNIPMNTKKSGNISPI